MRKTKYTLALSSIFLAMSVHASDDVTTTCSNGHTKIHIKLNHQTIKRNQGFTPHFEYWIDDDCTGNPHNVSGVIFQCLQQANGDKNCYHYSTGYYNGSQGAHIHVNGTLNDPKYSTDKIGEYDTSFDIRLETNDGSDCQVTAWNSVKVEE